MLDILTMQLRPYQREAIDATFRYYENGGTGHVLLCLPTGTGKTLVIAKTIQEIMSRWPSTRFVVLTHRKELIEQNADTMRRVWPTAPMGIYSAGLGSKDTVMPIIYAGVASVNHAIDMFGHRDIVFIDEAHLLSDNNASMYQKILARWHELNPYLKVIGLTATWYRLGQGLLTNGGLFSDIAYNICDTTGFMRLISDGYLVPPIPRATQTHLDVSNVAIHGGEFVLTQLQKAVDHPTVTHAAVRELVATGMKEGRRSWLVFCSGIEHSEHVADMLRGFGVHAAAVHSKITNDERDERINAFKRGQLTAITNNDILTTGFDHPPVDLIGMLRPTVSPSLWVQMLGRGTRPFPGKKDCTVLDFARNTIRLGTIDAPHIPNPKGKGNGEMPVKICPECNCYNHARAQFCFACGHKFEFKNKLDRSAGTNELLTGGIPEVHTFEVQRVIYNRHTSKKSGSTSVRVSYFCGLRKFDEWLSFDARGGYALHRAHEWWRQRFAGTIPRSTDEALIHVQSARVPRKVRVWVNKQYPEILGVEF